MSEIIFEENGKSVKFSYREACRDYCIGFALIWHSVAVTMHLMWVTLSLSQTTAKNEIVTFLFLVGVIMYWVAFSKPIWFYEMMEGVPKP